MDLSVRSTVDLAGLAAAPGVPRTGAGFAAILADSFRAHAERLGLELPDDAGTPAPVGTNAEPVDAIWQRARMAAIASGNGPGDAMMQSIKDAADARWERRQSGANTLFDI